MKVGVVGAGKLGKAIIKNVSKKCGIVAVKRKVERIEGAKVTQDIEDVAGCDVIFVTLKPNIFRENMEKIGEVAQETPVVSFAAGVKLNEMGKFIAKPYRAMTNLEIEEFSVVAYYPEEAKEYLNFLNAELIQCEDERELDLMTNYIGSSPALIAYLINALVLSAIKDGIDFNKAKKIAFHSFSSALKLYMRYGLEGVTERVATPGGTTIEGIVNSFEAQREFINSLQKITEKVLRI